MTNTKKIADVLTEKPILMRFGFLFFLARPLTLAQIYEIGSLVENTEKLELEGDINPVVMMMQRYRDLGTCSRIATTILFRGMLKRTLFGWYIRRHLTMKRYQRLVEYAAISFRAGFFLTSFTFLKGTKEVTRTTNTPEATVLGDSSEE